MFKQVRRTDNLHIPLISAIDYIPSHHGNIIGCGYGKIATNKTFKIVKI